MSARLSDSRFAMRVDTWGRIMSLEYEIATAIQAHERWKAKLIVSIENGTVSADVAEVGKDNVCAFGRWLYGSTIPKAARYDPNYITVQFLHYKFHECAGEIVQLLSDGKRAEAGALMASDGEYTRISDQLTATMIKWKDSVQKKRTHGEGLWLSLLRSHCAAAQRSALKPYPEFARYAAHSAREI